VTPGEALLDVLLGLEALHELDNLQIGHIDLRVLGGIEILLGIQHTLLEQILIDLHTVLLRNQHPALSVCGDIGPPYNSINNSCNDGV
jgi:hypothetical protein